MERKVVGIAVLAALLLAGCKGPDRPPAVVTHHGRFSGIGIYPAGSAWSKMAVGEQPKDAATARTDDDDQVIVVVDSDTGEIRQCGDVSGYCIGMNPWTKALAAPRIAPVTLSRPSTTGAGD